jgi:CubicO group peptidase (beta-lactamase class C family)
MKHHRPSIAVTMNSLEPRRLLSAMTSTLALKLEQHGTRIDVPFARATTVRDVSGDIYSIVRDNKVPAGAGGAIKDGELAALGASGKRRKDRTERVNTDDRFHLGSSGKAMTSTMVARLIEEGRLDWETRIVDVYPELDGQITSSFENVTVWQLMTNRSGISDAKVQTASNLIKLGTLSGDRQTQRNKMVPIVLKTAANGAPGANFEYSNFAYAVLGAMAERATGASFESLMVNYVFKPLRMDSAGFGPQGSDTGRKLWQPRGHNANGSPKTNSNDDLLAYLAPAGTMSMSVIDWGKFLKSQMGLKVNKRLLVQPATLERLHTPYDASGTQYAAGWVVTEVFGVKVLSHDGTNGNWYSTVQLIPQLKYAAYGVVNQGGSNGLSAAYDIKSKLIDEVPFL